MTSNVRVWDTHKNMYVPAGEVVISFYGETNVEVVPNCLEYVGDPVHSGESQYGRFIVEYEVGIRDVDSIPIYEGDLIRLEYINNSRIYECIGFLKYDPTHIGFRFIVNGLDKTWLFVDANQLSYKIIGHIHEEV